MPTLTWYRRSYVALSLFANMQNALAAKITEKIAKGWDPSLYFVGYRQGQVIRSIGWACVRDIRVATASWNEDMRNCKTLYAVWHDDGIATWRTNMRIDPSKYQPVQLTTVYAVRALTEMKAAEAALQLLLNGDQNHLEWYDASPDKRWSKLLGQPV
jgi:hypothetical protein